MKRIHIALGVSNIEPSVLGYSFRLTQQPNVVIPNEYALWRTRILNFSIRKVFQEESGMLRHLGWESSDTAHGSTDLDGHGILWEPFTAAQQDKAMRQTWPNLPNDPEP